MLYKILFVFFIFYILRMLYRSISVIKNMQENQGPTSAHKAKKRKEKDSDIIDAEYKVIKDDK